MSPVTDRRGCPRLGMCLSPFVPHAFRLGLRKDAMANPAAASVIWLHGDPNDAIASPDDVRPENDFDGDGATNRQELLAGTDATDSTSTFLFAAAPHALAGNRFVVRWNSVLGKTYAVRCSTNLLQGAGFQVLQGGIPGTGGVNAYTATVNAAHGFFMVEVE